MRSGELITTTLAAVCRRLGRQEATGCLVVTRDGDSGRILLRSGLVVGAVAPRAGDRLADRLVAAELLDPADLDGTPGSPEGVEADTELGHLLVERGLVAEEVVRLFLREGIRDALAELLGWREGAYRFEPGTVTASAPSEGLSVPRVLLEVSRRLRSREAVRRMVPDLDAVPEPTTTSTQEAVTLRPEELMLLAHVDGRRSVRALAGALGHDESTAARIVAGLHLLGVVALPATDTAERPDRPRAPAPEETAAPSPSGAATPDPGPPAADPWTAPVSSEDEPEVWQVDLGDLPVGGGQDEPLAPAAATTEENEAAGGADEAAAEERAAAEEAGESEPDEQGGQAPERPEAGPGAPSGTRGPRHSSDEVSAFLRELSRLSNETTGSASGKRTGSRRERDERERGDEDDS